MQELIMHGLWMPDELITTKEISDKQKFMYGMILYFSKMNKSCHIPNSFFMKKLHLSKTQTSKLVNSLKTKGYIKSKVIRNEKNEITDRIITPMVFFNNTYDTKVKSPMKENDNPPIEEKCKDNKNKEGLV